MLKKLLESLAFSPLIVFLIACTALYFRRRGDLRTAYRVSVAGLAFVLLLTQSAFVVLVAAPLNSWVPDNSLEKADAVVALGSDATPFGAPTSGSTERAFVGAQVLMSGRAPRLFLTGASDGDSLAGARSMKIVALGMGAPDSLIGLLPGFDTHEESVSAGRYLGALGIRRIILVTHPYHLPRAAAAFRRQGFIVIPHAVPFPRVRWTEGFLWGNIGRLQSVCHEYAGLLVYKMKGWAD